ncbi:MAG: DUF3429 domain-containing protein [Rubrivivax sp.]|nr:DUF3429 domain-containing protein [Rubrivivax sp.]
MPLNALPDHAAAVPPMAAGGPINPPTRPTRWALGLGYAGLLPFVAGALLLWLLRGEAQGHVALALSAYAALILSFLGGIHWGLAMRQPAAATAGLVWGVVPSLLAWPALLMPAFSALVIHGALLLLSYAVDRRSYPAHGAAAWLGLRFRLSAVAALSCFIGAAAH